MLLSDLKIWKNKIFTETFLTLCWQSLLIASWVQLGIKGQKEAVGCGLGSPCA